MVYYYAIDDRYEGLNERGFIINDISNTDRHMKPCHLSICQQIYQPPHGASKLSSHPREASEATAVSTLAWEKLRPINDHTWGDEGKLSAPR